MFERFNDAARRSVVLAQHVAADAGADVIDPRHLAVALVTLPNGAAPAVATVLRHLNPNLLMDSLRTGNGPTDHNRRVPFSPELKKVLELSLRESLSIGSNYIGAEHLLLAELRCALVVERYWRVER